MSEEDHHRSSEISPMISHENYKKSSGMILSQETRRSDPNWPEFYQNLSKGTRNFKDCLKRLHVCLFQISRDAGDSLRQPSTVITFSWR